MTQCALCGTTLNASVDTCPSCGARKVRVRPRAGILRRLAALSFVVLGGFAFMIDRFLLAAGLMAFGAYLMLVVPKRERWVRQP